MESKENLYIRKQNESTEILREIKNVGGNRVGEIQFQIV
jgi:hypothetical protein